MGLCLYIIATPLLRFFSENIDHRRWSKRCTPQGVPTFKKPIKSQKTPCNNPSLSNLISGPNQSCFCSLQLWFCHSSFLVHGPANDLPLPPVHCHLELECHKSSFFTSTGFRGFTVFQLLPSRRVLVHLCAGSGFRSDLRSSFSYLDSGNAGRLTKGQILKKIVYLRECSQIT